MEKVATKKIKSGGGTFSVALYRPSDDSDAEFGLFCRVCGFDPGISEAEIAMITHAFVVAKTDEGSVVGFAQFNGGPYCHDVFVKEDFRRMGVATAMYDLYEDVDGVTLRRHDASSEDAYLFWKNREKSRR